jgi:cytochrome bd ubiquinol oxidase subunit II
VPVSLAEVPVILVLVGLAAYTVLGGADFGAGFWQLTPGSGRRARAIREHAHNVIGPVWEANHVWLIFVLVVCWTAYPRPFGAISTTMALPLFIAGIGIVLRGTFYALHAATETDPEQRRVEMSFAVSSVLTPFALGTVIGGIASGRVPAGPGHGDLVTSWLNPSSIAIGVLAVAVAAYLAAVYLAADAVRHGDRELEDAFRVRALVMAGVAGAAAVIDLFVLRDDARRIWDGLTSGAGLVAVVISALAGVGTVALVLLRRYSLARLTAAAAVVAVIAGWGIAQQPDILPGLTIEQAAAGRSSIIALLVALALGALALAPSLAFLFTLVLRGRFDPRAERDEAPVATATADSGWRERLLPVALGLFVVSALIMLAFDSTWTRIVGVAGLLGSVSAGFVALGGLFTAAEAEVPKAGEPGLK